MPAPHPTPRWRFANAIFALGLLAALLSPGDAAAISYTAVLGTGPYSNTATWNPTGIPGPGDDITVPNGATVDFSGTINVDAVTIQNGGEMVGQAPLNTLELTNLTVNPGGTLRGFDAGPGGGSIVIRPQTSPNLAVQNDGIIRGGHPSGHLTITDDANMNQELNCSYPSSIQSVAGQFLGGNLNGNVSMTSGLIDLFDATVAGGGGFAPVIGGQSRSGGVNILGFNISLTGMTTVTSGDNLTPGGWAGRVSIVAATCGLNSSLGIGPNVVVNPGNAAQMDCLLLYSGGTSTIQGTIGSNITQCALWDPPDLQLTGEGQLRAERLTVAGENFSAEGLVGPGLQAGSSLEIILSPGGVLDLRGLEPGTAYFEAGESLTLCADEIWLDPGVHVKDLMQPPPRLCDGQNWLALSLTPGIAQRVQPGDVLELQLHATNVGNGSGDVIVEISDSAGWLVGGPQDAAVALGPGEVIQFTVDVEVPPGVDEGQTTLYFVGQIGNQETQSESSTFYLN